LAEIHDLAQNQRFVENFVAEHQMEMQFDGRGFDVALLGIAVLSEGGEVDVGPRLMPVCAASRLDFGRIFLLTPHVGSARAGFLLQEGVKIGGSLFATGPEFESFVEDWIAGMEGARLILAFFADARQAPVVLTRHATRFPISTRLLVVLLLFALSGLELGQGAFETVGDVELETHHRRIFGRSVRDFHLLETQPIWRIDVGDVLLDWFWRFGFIMKADRTSGDGHELGEVGRFPITTRPVLIRIVKIGFPGVERTRLGVIRRLFEFFPTS